MILRRLTQSLKEQNWMAIAIEFVLVVVGVFLGSQASNWNDARNLEQRKAAAMARMHAESEADVAYLQKRVDVLTGDGALRTEALRRLSSGDWQGADAGKMSDALDTLGLAPALSPPRGVYDELISTGLFGELGEAHVRDAISDYVAYLAFVQRQIDFIRSDLVARSSRQRFPGVRLEFDPTARRQVRRIYDFPALSTDRDFVDSAILDNEGRIAIEQWTTIALEKAKAMCQEIARADGRSCKAVEGGKP